MSLSILVLSILLIIQILGIAVIQNVKNTALKVSENDFVVESVSGKRVMAGFFKG